MLDDNDYVILKDLFEAKVPIRLIFHNESEVVFNRDRLELTKESLSEKLSILIENGFVECFDKNNCLVTTPIIGNEDMFLGLTHLGGQTIEQKLMVNWLDYKNLEEKYLDKYDYCNWSIEAKSMDEINRVTEYIREKKNIQYTINKLVPWRPVYWKTLDVGYKITIESPITLCKEYTSIIYKWGISGYLNTH